MRIIRFIKDWMLLFAILAGIVSYFLYVRIPLFDGTHALAFQAVKIIQPVLIFGMLFLTFCKINPREIRLCRWHWWALAFQTLIFAAIGAVVVSLPPGGLRITLEGAMICFICPVGTAAAVIARRLGGSTTDVTTYTILINIVAAIVIPVAIPWVHPQAGMSIVRASLLILGKVFPLLLLPLLSALLLRRIAPKACDKLGHYQPLAFYIWVLALIFATVVTTRFLVHSDMPFSVGAALVGVALTACLTQFMFGWKLGERTGDKASPGESLGQKNTVFAIWLGYTFFTPITSLAGGFYSIFQNTINSYNLYRRSHAEAAAKEEARHSAASA